MTPTPVRPPVQTSSLPESGSSVSVERVGTLPSRPRYVYTRAGAVGPVAFFFETSEVLLSMCSALHRGSGGRVMLHPTPLLFVSEFEVRS